MLFRSEPESVLAAIGDGAAGFLAKTVEAEPFVQSVQRAIAGGVVAPAGAVPARAEAVRPELSERQRDVLRLLVEGKTNKLIARELGLTEPTVKTHLQAVFRKLEADNRTRAVLAAARWRLTL